MISDAFSKTKDGLYRNNVGVVLLNSQKKIFVGKRYAPPTAVSSWQMPQGGISESESEEEALIREIKEEVGIFPNTFSIKNKTKTHFYYVIPPKVRKSIWNNIYIGQKQRWFLVDFTGKDEDININTEFPEFSHWSWKKAEEVLENAVSFKKDVYIAVLKEFNLI